MIIHYSWLGIGVLIGLIIYSVNEVIVRRKTYGLVGKRVRIIDWYEEFIGEEGVITEYVSSLKKYRVLLDKKDSFNKYILKMLDRKYLVLLDVDSQKIKKGGFKMPRIIKFAFYFLFLFLFWKFVSHSDQMVQFLAKKYL